MPDLGSRLQSIRKKSSWSPSQVEVAEKLNIAQSTYARFESGSREPPISFIIQFCKLFKVSSDYLLGLSDSLATAIYKETNLSTDGLLNTKRPRNPLDGLTEEQIRHVTTLINSFIAENEALIQADLVSEQEA